MVYVKASAKDELYLGQREAESLPMHRLPVQHADVLPARDRNLQDLELAQILRLLLLLVEHLLQFVLLGERLGHVLLL